MMKNDVRNKAIIETGVTPSVTYHQWERMTHEEKAAEMLTCYKNQATKVKIRTGAVKVGTGAVALLAIASAVAAPPSTSRDWIDYDKWTERLSPAEGNLGGKAITTLLPANMLPGVLHELQFLLERTKENYILGWGAGVINYNGIPGGLALRLPSPSALQAPWQAIYPIYQNAPTMGR